MYVVVLIFLFPVHINILFFLEITCTFYTHNIYISYVGDHLFADVTVAKSSHRWRTALVLQELEEEVKALAHRDGRREIHVKRTDITCILCR
jgi:hypothetical protein